MDSKKSGFVLAGVRGGPCNPSYWEARIWGCIVDMESTAGLRMPFGVSATDEKRTLERQTHSQYVDAVNPQ